MTNPARTRLAWRFLAGLITAGLILPVYAFKLDSDTPIKVASDNARLDDQKGTATYSGNVRVSQGEAVLTADKVVLYRGNSQNLSRMEATGNPATYKQPQTEQAPAVYAEGRTIIYEAKEERIIFEREALIRQQGDRFRGNRIVYDLGERIVTASSSENDDQDRVEMTIQPDRDGTNDNGSN